MKLNDKKFGKIFVEPNRTEPAKISQTPNRTEISVAPYSQCKTFIRCDVEDDRFCRNIVIMREVKER